MKKSIKDANIIGIDIGGTKCAVVLGDDKANIYDKISFPTETQKGLKQALDNIFNSIDNILKKNKILIKQIKSFGISCGGPLDSKKGLILSPPNLPGWDKVALVDMIRKRYNCKAFLQNDANACAYAEWKFGAGRGCSNMIFLTFGTGMGAGLVLDGRLYSGTNDLAGEVGHIRLEKEGPVGYHKAGSFEGFCSGGGIVQLARTEIVKFINKGQKVAFCQDIKKLELLTAKDIGEAAHKGDPVAIDIFKIVGRHLGAGLSILIDILNPERIIIGSIFTRNKDFILPYAEELIKQEALEPAYKKSKILPAALGEQIGDYACLSVALL